MANIAKTYTMVNSQPADATQVNKNFDDIIAGVGDLTTLRPTVASLGLDADIATLALPANTTISAAGAELINDADAAAQRATLGGIVVGPASVVAGRLVRFADTTGKVIFDGGVVTTAGLNLLDDATAAAQLATLGTAAYSEGTWTPVLNGFTIVGAAPAVSGTYKRIGNIVFITCRIFAGAGGNTSVAATQYTSFISGLPVASAIQAPAIFETSGIAFLGAGISNAASVYSPSFAAQGESIYIAATYAG